MNDTNNNKKKLTISVTGLIILCLCLCVTSFALGMVTFMVKDNTFQTGIIDIELVEKGFKIGDDCVDGDDFLFEPGMHVTKEFTVINKSTDENGVYYRLYFENVDGFLADVLEVTIWHVDAAGNTVGVPVLEGKMGDLSRTKVNTAETLAPNQSVSFLAQFHYPSNEGNNGQGKIAQFTLCAEAVQTSNNPNKLFD